MGNSANFVECEQLLVERHITKSELSSKDPKLNALKLQMDVYSVVQVRGSVPFYWTQESGRTKIDRSIESSAGGFIKHFESLASDYCEHYGKEKNA